MGLMCWYKWGGWRVAAVGIATTSATLVPGCGSAEQELAPPLQNAAAFYPGLPQQAMAPGAEPAARLGTPRLAVAPAAPVSVLPPTLSESAAQLAAYSATRSVIPLPAQHGAALAAQLTPQSTVQPPLAAPAPASFLASTAPGASGRIAPAALTEPVKPVMPGKPGRPADGAKAPSAPAVPMAPKGTNSARKPELPDSQNTIDLGVALRLAGVDNPTIGLARERVREALAIHLGARSLLLPSVTVGGNYRYHSGPLEDDPGEFRSTTLQSLYLGLGAFAVGTNPTFLPGVRLFAHLGDAIYEPLAARQVVATRRSDAQAVQNQIMLQVAVAFLNLIEAESRLDILKRADAEVSELARITADFARTGQGPPSDASRTEGRMEQVRRQLHQAEGDVAASSARLTRLLNLDPSVRLRTPGGPVGVLHLLPENDPVEQLIGVAARARPELLAWRASIQEARTRVRQEQTRPFFPTLSVGYSAGGFGGGGSLSGPKTSPMNYRADFDVFAVWNAQNLGVGNRSRIRAAKARLSQAIASYDTALNQVRQDVASAQAEAQAAAIQVQVARTAVVEAGEGYKLETERVRLGQGRPIEGIDNFRQLLEARLELLRRVIAYDAAQFRLYVAVGSNPAASPEATQPNALIPGP